jgi:hypothetical protein
MAIRVVRVEEWERARDLRLRALADAPESFGSSLEEEERLSESAWRERMASRDSVWFVEATDDYEFVGMAVGVLDDPSETAYLNAMWVEPGAPALRDWQETRRDRHRVGARTRSFSHRTGGE